MPPSVLQPFDPDDSNRTLAAPGASSMRPSPDRQEGRLDLEVVRIE